MRRLGRLDLILQPRGCKDLSRRNAKRLSKGDPAFAGLPKEFDIIESHIGQIAYSPKGWTRVVTRGPGAKTENQCLRVVDRYIYAAQFHMEAEGTPKSSVAIMTNFLRLAKEWGGYNPKANAVPAP